LRGNPHVPESGYDVGQIFRARVGGVEDYYFAGVNAENADHRSGTHGEEGAISAMAAALGKHAEIVEGWGIGAPRARKPGDGDAFSDMAGSACGKCRQQMAGFAGENVPLHDISLNGAIQSTTMGALLPNRFSFRNFIPELKDVNNASARAPSAEEVEARLMRRAGPVLAKKSVWEWLRDLSSVDWATQTSQSAVLELDNGMLVGGTKVEEAGFVSINAIQAATSIATSEFGARSVREAWIYTKSRGKEQPAPEAYGTLTMAALGTLHEFAAHDDIPITFFNDSPLPLDRTLMDAARIAAKTSRKFYTPGK
jgi:cytidine deaminase